MTVGFFGESGNEAVSNLDIDETLFYKSEFDLGLSSTNVALDFNKRNKMKYTLDGSPTVTFSDNPGGPTGLLIRITHSGADAHVITWPVNVKWPAGAIPLLSTGDGKIDIITFYFDGTDYYGNVSLNFA